MGPFRVGTRLGFAAVLVLAAAACAASLAATTVHRDPSAGGTRSWAEYTPPGLPSRPVPLVVVLHGLGETPAAIAAVTGLDAAARTDHFVVAYPMGIDASWDAGTCCGAAVARRVDDIAFIASVVTGLSTSGRIDPHRVYVVGFSNGAMMTWALACARAQLFAAAAVVEGTLAAPCPNHAPLSLLVLHQRDDDLVPFRGTLTPDPGLGTTGPLPPVESALATWLRAEGCTSPAAVAPSTLTVPYEQDAYPCPGPTRTVLVLLDGGTHIWPRPPDSALDATAVVTAFFGLRS